MEKGNWLIRVYLEFKMVIKTGLGGICRWISQCSVPAVARGVIRGCKPLDLMKVVVIYF